jgi:2-amino-4-hydroxy-6-hydroxymethyldihydropteridine diphosphokinase
MIQGMKKVFLCLGSNLGDRAESLKQAELRIAEHLGSIVSVSSVYETEPWGFESENKFLNKVLCIKTDLSPSGLLGRILMIESQLGRIRCETQYQSRNIDIDILFFNNDIVKEPALEIPHPRMHERRFALVPIVEIAPDLVHPVLKKTMKKLLKSCSDNGKVELVK